MNMSSFFIDRPIFASVIALFITLLGAFAYPALPLAQYPEIAPPSVAVTAAFPGASAETMAETIAVICITTQKSMPALRSGNQVDTFATDGHFHFEIRRRTKIACMRCRNPHHEEC